MRAACGIIRAGRGLGQSHRVSGQRGPVVVPRNRMVDPEGPLAGPFCCRSGRRKWASCPFFVSGADGGRVRDKLFGLLEPVVAALGYELRRRRVEFGRAQFAGAGVHRPHGRRRDRARRLRAGEPLDRGGAGCRGPDRARVPARGLLARVRPAVADRGALRAVRGQRGADRAGDADRGSAQVSRPARAGRGWPE